MIPVSASFLSELGQASLAMLVATQANVPSRADQAHDWKRSQVGQELQPCTTCPTFVRTPEATSTLRRIVYVAKYEVTWRQYLAAVDENACPAPKRTLVGTGEVSTAALTDELRLDWPIELQEMGELNCFTNWLTTKTELKVAVPTTKEWDWFAAAGDAKARFPWGDSETDPPAAVPGVRVARTNESPYIHSLDTTRFIVGVRVGSFPPNGWGLFDVIGNAFELTTTEPTTLVGQRSKSSAKQYRVRGGDRYTSNWVGGLRPLTSLSSFETVAFHTQYRLDTS